jgi:hypothetical protein
MCAIDLSIDLSMYTSIYLSTACVVALQDNTLAVNNNTTRFEPLLKLVHTAVFTSLQETPMQFGFTTVIVQPNQKNRRDFGFDRLHRPIARHGWRIMGRCRCHAIFQQYRSTSALCEQFRMRAIVFLDALMSILFNVHDIARAVPEVWPKCAAPITC